MSPIYACAGVVSAALAAGVSLTFAAPQPIPSPDSGAIICLNPDGERAFGGFHCTALPGASHTSCRCPGRSTHDTVDYCKPDEKPAPDQVDANRARAAAAANGTLRTATFQGRRFCARDPYRKQDSYSSSWGSPMDNGVGGVPTPPCCGGA